MYTSRSAAIIASALVLHSHPPLRQGELERITGLSHGHIQRGIETLRRLGLIIAESTKGYEMYQIDSSSPYSSAMQQAALVDGGFVESLRDLQAKIRFVMVIGSFAWGKPHANSDIDLLIVGDITHEEVQGRLSNLAQAYERNIDTIVLTDREMRKRLADNDYMLVNALNQGVLLTGDNTRVPRV